jgi:hypothetical protein
MLYEFVSSCPSFSPSPLLFSLFLIRSVSALLVLAGSDEHKKKPNFQTVLLEQIQSLRESLGHENDAPPSYVA